MVGCESRIPSPSCHSLLNIPLGSERKSFVVCKMKGKLPGQHQRSVPPKPAISKSPLKKAGAGLNVQSCFLLPSCPMVYSSTFIHLLETRPAFSFRGAVFVYGLFDWSLSPSCNNWETPLTMKMENVKRFGEAYLGDRTMEERRDPAILPLSITGFSGIRARSSLLWRI